MRGAELLEAAKAGDVERVRALLDEDPSLAAWRDQSGDTPLMAALYRGHRTLSQELADASAKSRPLDLFAVAALGRLADLDAALRYGHVNDYAYDGWTPLHLAAFFGHEAVAAQLLDRGAEIGTVSRNALTNTPLHAAVAGGHQGLALMLIERGADVAATDAGGHTALHIAAESGLLAIVEALLARGADPHAVDAEDKTPLSRAAARNHTAVVDAMNLSR